MATTISAAAQPAIEYPDDDGEPMADNTLQFKWIVLIKDGLEHRFQDDPDVFVAGDLLWYPTLTNGPWRAGYERENAWKRFPRWTGSSVLASASGLSQGKVLTISRSSALAASRFGPTWRISIEERPQNIAPRPNGETPRPNGSAPSTPRSAPRGTPRDCESLASNRIDSGKRSTELALSSGLCRETRDKRPSVPASSGRWTAPGPRPGRRNAGTENQTWPGFPNKETTRCVRDDGRRRARPSLQSSRGPAGARGNRYEGDGAWAGCAWCVIGAIRRGFWPGRAGLG